MIRCLFFNQQNTDSPVRQQSIFLSEEVLHFLVSAGCAHTDKVSICEFFKTRVLLFRSPDRGFFSNSTFATGTASFCASPAIDSTTAFEGSGVYRDMRGGGWSNRPLGVRVSHRVPLTQDFGHHALGVRHVMAK